MESTKEIRSFKTRNEQFEQARLTEVFRQVAEIQLTYKSKVKPSLRPEISCSEDAYKILINIWDESRLEFIEQFKVLLLNRANKVLGISEVSSGGVSGTFVDLKLIFATALKANATSIILTHNHPSGYAHPSQLDIKLTNKMQEAGKVLKLPVLDHLIITSEGYYSFADEGLL